MQNVALQNSAIRVNDYSFIYKGLCGQKSGGGGNRTAIDTPSGKNTPEIEAAQIQAKAAHNSELQSPTETSRKHKPAQSECYSTSH
jgi:hypothetical protein